ncbi:MAG: N-acetylglucosamine-6-phosphate deacetylase [Oscillospiraceae bacterium]|nr:N-acetylglucosamine-6-phosphate deacetylase [Oscillospiraceae bacterium]
MIIGSRRVWISGGFVPAGIEMLEGKIRRVLSYDAAVDEDFGDSRIFPGFIDVHAHGCFGFDTNDANLEGLQKWARSLPAEGVTAFLPTTVTQDMKTLHAALKNIDEAASKEYSGAEILGAHLEGPFISKKYKGAHVEQFIVKPDIALFQELQKSSGGRIRLVTLAPEEDDDFALTRFCAETGVMVSIGHSGATFEQAALSASNGAVSMTHVYNAMSPYNHREPGLVGAALYCNHLFGEIICDCIHVHPAAIANLFRAKGPDHVIAITDSLSAKGCAAGSFKIGQDTIEIYPDGSAHLPNGTLAGSTLRMNESFRNLIVRAAVPMESAVNACTINPARLLKLDSRKGRISSGYDADIVVLKDDYSVLATYCRGNPSFGGRG